MNTTALLAELRTNILRDASSADSLWTDATLVQYLNDAYEEFAEETLTLRDKTTAAVTQITLATGVTDYALHDAVLTVYSARYDTDTYDLPLITHPTVYDHVQRDTDWFDVNNAASTPGRPQAIQLDEATKTFTVYPAPTSAESGKLIRLRVARLPLTLFTVGVDIVPDLPNRYHLALCDGAAALALDNHDVDGEGPARSGRRRAKFDRAMMLAKRRFKRLTKAPTRIDTGWFGWP